MDHVILDTQVSSDDQAEFVEAMRRWAEITRAPAAFDTTATTED